MNATLVLTGGQVLTVDREFTVAEVRAPARPGTRIVEGAGGPGAGPANPVKRGCFGELTVLQEQVKTSA